MTISAFAFVSSIFVIGACFVVVNTALHIFKEIQEDDNRD